MFDIFYIPSILIYFNQFLDIRVGTRVKKLKEKGNARANQSCQLGDLITRLSNFSDSFSGIFFFFFKKSA